MSNQMLFPQIIEISVLPGRASQEKKCIFHEGILYHYLQRKINGWSAADFLKEKKIEKYALYAVTDFMELFIKDLEKNGGRKPEIICDKNAERFYYGVNSYEVISPEKLVCLYRDRKIEKIIIMSVLHENEIIDELLEKGVLLNDIISFISVVYS